MKTDPFYRFYHVAVGIIFFYHTCKFGISLPFQRRTKCQYVKQPLHKYFIISFAETIEFSRNRKCSLRFDRLNANFYHT